MELHWIPIFLTFFIEAISIVGLLFKRYRKYALAFSIPFHIVIGFTGYAFFMDFSTIVLAIYALTISNESLIRVRTFYKKTFRSYWLKNVISLFPIIFVLTIFIYVTIICKWVCSNESFMPIFAFYSVPIYLILLFSKDSKNGDLRNLNQAIYFYI